MIYNGIVYCEYNYGTMTGEDGAAESIGITMETNSRVRVGSTEGCVE